MQALTNARKFPTTAGLEDVPLSLTERERGFLEDKLLATLVVMALDPPSDTALDLAIVNATVNSSRIAKSAA